MFRNKVVVSIYFINPLNSFKVLLQSDVTPSCDFIQLILTRVLIHTGHVLVLNQFYFILGVSKQ